MTKIRRVLIVDDDQRNILALSAVMRAKGFMVESALNGESGLAVLKTNPGIDLVLMDIMMPVMDGYQAIRAIREDKKISDTPIIALTAKAMKTDRKKCIEAGASDFCPKPVDINLLMQKIDNCLK